MKKLMIFAMLSRNSGQSWRTMLATDYKEILTPCPLDNLLYSKSYVSLLVDGIYWAVLYASSGATSQALCLD